MENSKEAVALKFLQKIISDSPYRGKVFIAGGAVRDQLMGAPVKDIDIVVADKDGGIEFANWITKKIGAYKEGANPVIFPRFGTAKFNLRGANLDGVDLSDIDIESVMTRAEKYETGSRKPEVVYADLKTDVLRRDLTINSLLQDLTTGEIKDLTGKGVSDIENKIIRTPLDPDITFEDDPLRMLRAIRFATRYNWNISRELINSILRNADKLQSISSERIQDELNKILMTDNAELGVRLLSSTGLNRHIIPELDKCKGVTQNEHHKHDVFDHIMEVLKHTPKDLNSRLAAIFHDIGKPQTRSVGDDGRVHFYDHENVGADMTKDIMTRLRYPNEKSDAVSKIVANHMRLKQAGPDGTRATDKVLRKFAYALGPELNSALKMMHADNISHAGPSAQPNQIPGLQKRFQSLNMEGPKDKPTLPINGNDVIKALNIKPGPVIKQLLAAVEDAWMENPNIDRETALTLVKNQYQGVRRKSLADRLTDKITNPITKNQILVRTALGYDKTHPAKIAAQKYLKGL